MNARLPILNSMIAKITTLFLLLFLIVGCSDPLPLNKLNYQGDWQNTNVQLIINRDGTVSYKKVVDGKTITIDAPIKSFIGNDIEVGVGWFSTVFEVSEPPQEVDGLWQMTVDGYRLTKQ